MARKRRRRNYGDNAERHSEWGSDDVSEASRQAVESVHLARVGKCDSANNILANARALFAAGVAHSKAGGRITSIGPVGETLARATREFKSHCRVVARRA